MAKMTVAGAMKDKAEREIENLSKNPNNIFNSVKFMQKDGKDTEEMKEEFLSYE